MILQGTKKGHKMMNTLRNERGVAMITVLMVASVLTVVASTATFVTIQEFRSSNDDRAAGQALSFGEGGIDRMVMTIKRSDYDWGELIQSGCPGNPTITIPGQVASGSFEVEVKNPDCPDPAALPDPFEEQTLVITSRGTGGQASREVEQVVRVVSGGLPIGVFAFSFASIDGFGTGVFRNISLITPGNVVNRDKLETVGCDVWYTQDQFYGNGKTTRFDTSAGTPCDPNVHLPAAVHAGGQIECGSAGTCNPAGQPKIEHVPPGTTSGTLPNKDDVNCTAASGGQNSGWDGSSNGGSTTGLPSCGSMGKAPTSLFTPEKALELQPKPDLTEDDYDNLKAGAQASGIYCDRVSNRTRCFKKGVLHCSNCGTFTNMDLTGLPNNWVFYADFPASSAAPSALPKIDFNANLGSCSLDKDLNKSTVVVARNGSVSLAANKGIAGAILAREGLVDVGGGALVHGSIIAKELLFRGSSDFLMDKCSIQALRSPFITVSPVTWREVDR